MLKKILSIGVPVLLATVAYLIFRKMFTDNDSPIVVTDTSTGFDGKGKEPPKHPKTTVCHQRGFGKNHNNHHTVHDLDNFRPACLVFPSRPVQIQPDATSFEINYTASDGSSGLLMSWSSPGTPRNDPGDITIGPGFLKATNTTVHKEVQVVSMDWKIDDGIFQTETPSGTMLVTVNYCPQGNCTCKGKKTCK